ncbi:2-dehydropantoate 2-reductase [Paraconexibacter sp. AEG42_29]|uniref:2-dehydropantoate 2-reductase n=1 Tax=Paraconexibacter sp. AEG42_29 TaxID=2997339 RepID=A0AAU7AZY5_9ACTN
MAADTPTRLRFAVLGAGAIGTWIGAALAESGADVTLVARGAHLDALVRDGARLVSADGERTVPVRAVQDTGQVGPVDVVILAVKVHDVVAAGPALQGLLGPDTTVVAAQNGVPYWQFHGRADDGASTRLESIDPGGAVSALLPPERILGCVVYLGASILAPGVVATRPEAGLILGEPDGTSSPRLEQVARALEHAGFPVRRTADIRAEIWTKLMGNASINLVSVLTRAGLGTMVNDAGTGPIVATLMREVVEIAGAAGARPQISVDERLRITARLGDHKSSTLQDLEAGKRLELDALGAAVIEVADAVGVAAPMLRAVYALADLQARTLGLR